MSNAEPTWVHEARDRAASLRNLAEASSKGPWFIRAADDPCFMSATYITSGEPAGGSWAEKWDHPKSVIAITLLQEPSLAMSDEEEENSLFIAAARTEVPWLCQTLERALEERNVLVEAVRVLVANRGNVVSSEAVKRAQNMIGGGGESGGP